MSTGVLTELPSWAKEEADYRWLRNLKTAYGRDPETQKMTFFTFCRHCGGWVRGDAVRKEECTMSIHHPLSGRRGESYHCPRCRTEIDFSGAVA